MRPPAARPPRDRLRVSRRSVLAAIGFLLALIAFSPFVRPAAAASPSPGPSAAPGASAVPAIVPEPGVQIWFDEPRPATFAPGAEVTLGFVLWDANALALVKDSTPFIRLRSPSEPPGRVDNIAHEDTPGHFVGVVTAPTDGPGTLEVGFTGMTCAPQGGGCQDVEFVFAEGGVGPPPDARLISLARAAIQSLPEPIAAGRPIDVTVELTLVGPWEVADIKPPNLLLVLTRETRDTDLASSVRSDPANPLRYVGQVTFPQPGTFDVDVSTEPNRSAAVVFPGSAIKVTVVEAPLVEAGGIPMPLLVIGGGLALVLVGLVARKALADL